MIRISLVEDNRYVLQGWSAVLGNVKDFNLLGAYASCEEALQSESLSKSNVVLMDIGLPGMSGIQGAKAIAEKWPGIAVVMCTVYDDDANIFDAICAGAVGYMLKKTPVEELVAAIRMAAAGGSPMTPNIARKVIASFQKKTIQKEEELNERETEILTLLAQGKSYNSIAQDLFLSVDGVRYHIRHIYEKLQVSSRGEATAKGLQYKIIELPGKEQKSE